MAVPVAQSTPTVVEHIVAALSDHILSGADGFKPGTRLRIATLCELFGSSSTPLKEALRELHAQGLVEISPRRGTTVASLSRRDHEEIFSLRAELELVAMKLAPAVLNPRVLEMLDQALAEMRSAVSDGRTVEYHRLDCQFHGLIASLGENSRLTGFYIDLLRQYRMRPAYMSTTVADMRVSLLEHRTIAAAIRGGEYAGAGDLIAAHYEYARRRNETSPDALQRQVLTEASRDG